MLNGANFKRTWRALRSAPKRYDTSISYFDKNLNFWKRKMLSSIVAFVYRNDSQRDIFGTHILNFALYILIIALRGYVKPFNTLRRRVFGHLFIMPNDFLSDENERYAHIRAKRRASSSLSMNFWLNQDEWSYFFQLSFLAVLRIWLSFLLWSQWRTNRKGRIQLNFHFTEHQSQISQ